MVETDPDADLDTHLFWTIYGVNAEPDGTRTEESVSDVEDEAAALALLRKILGPFTKDPRTSNGGYYVSLPKALEAEANKAS